MKPICINNYCFDHIHLWIQYHYAVPQFVEVAIEVFYPRDQQANGLVMFNHGFLIGNDLLWYPKKIAGMLLDDNPLFGINPSAYYNYSEAIVEKNWAMAFVSASHAQVDWMPWTDIGGNPRVGQETFAAASYLIRYGLTEFFWLAEAQGPNSKRFDAKLASDAQFMVSNNVIFAGHSVGGAHAQAAACGFDTLRQIGRKQCRPFNPVIYNRELLPAFSRPMADWSEEDRANPVGLLMLSPVDQKVPIFMPGMSDYRAALSSRQMPMTMIVGQCDCACLDMSQPPAWSDTPGVESEFSQLTGDGSWVVASQVERGSHCGYLTDKSPLCSVADLPSQCKRCPGVDVYKPMGAETAFTTELLGKFIDLYPNGGGFPGGFNDWIDSEFITWLNRQSPCCDLNLMSMPGGGYIDNVPPV